MFDFKYYIVYLLHVLQYKIVLRVVALEADEFEYLSFNSY